MHDSDFDDALENFDRFKTNLTPSTDYNEANTRFKIIDEIFLHCLAWEKSDVSLEEHIDKGYADYKFSTSRPMLIIEAKKEGEYFDLPVTAKTDKMSVVNLKGLMKNNASASRALSQVATYCQKSGIPYALVTNGSQFICFIASRNDSQNPLEGKAVIFPSLESVSADFTLFWNLFSKVGVQKNKIRELLLGKAQPKIPPRLADIISDYPGPQRRNSLQNDLRIVSELILEDLLHEDLEKQFLKECYCSSGVLSSHSLLAKNILQNRYSEIKTGTGSTPELIKVNTKKGISKDFLSKVINRRPVLLLGDVGSGKSTFIRHLIKVDAENFFKKGLALHVDLGTKTILEADVKDAVLDEIIRLIREDYAIDIYEDKFIRDVYKDELKRFSNGVNKSLKALDPTDYQKREISHLIDLQENKANHAKNSIKTIAERGKSIVIFLDNCDQRTTQDQQEVFLIAEQIADTWPVTVFVSLRPETFAISNQEGVLKAYHAKAFTIDPPSMVDVLQKRLKFGLKIAKGEVSVPSLKDTELKLEQLSNLLQVMITSLKDNPDLVAFIDNVASGNARQAIDMVKDFFGSGHINTEKILRIYDESGYYKIPLHEFLRAVIYGENQYYDPRTSMIKNIFAVNTEDAKEHFLLFALLIILDKESKNAGVKRKGFINVDFLYDKLQVLGYTPDQIDGCFMNAIANNLVETNEKVLIESNARHSNLVRPTSSGACYVKILYSMFAYIDAVSVDTPIFGNESQEKILIPGLPLDIRLRRTEEFHKYLDDIFESSIGTSSDIPEVLEAWRAGSKKIRGDIEYIKKQPVTPYRVNSF